MKIHQVVQYLCTSLYVCYTLIKKLFCVWAACSMVRWKLNPRCALGGLTGASSAWCWGVRWWQPFGEQFSSCWGWWDVLFRLVGCYISSRSVTVINQKIRQNGLWSKNFMNEPAICSHTLVALQIWYLHKKNALQSSLYSCAYIYYYGRKDKKKGRVLLLFVFPSVPRRVPFIQLECTINVH